MLAISPDARPGVPCADQWHGPSTERTTDAPSGPPTRTAGGPRRCTHAAVQRLHRAVGHRMSTVPGPRATAGPRCGCACPAAGSRARTTPRTSTPEPTTRRPTIPSPSGCPAAHTRGGVMSIDARSEPDRHGASPVGTPSTEPGRLDLGLGLRTARPGGALDALARFELLVDLEEVLDLEAVELRAGGGCRAGAPAVGRARGRRSACRRRRPRRACGTCRSCGTARARRGTAALRR